MVEHAALNERPIGAAWEQVATALCAAVGPATWANGLASLVGVSLHDGAIVVGAPSRFHLDYIQARHREAIERAVHSALGPDVGLELVVSDQREGTWTDRVAEVAAGQRPALPADGDREPSFDRNYSFRTFVVGPSNRLAWAAALSVAERSDDAYSPLFIHGPSGNGKTHLLKAAALLFREESPDLQVRYVTLERFVNEFVDGIRTHRLEDFKRRYRQCDLLLVDDVQFLEGKEGTQEEFFHTFNDLTEHGGRLVLTADRNPTQIGTLPERLRTRFRSGLVANLSAPEVETRRQIVAKKAALTGVELPAEVIELIAASVTTSVRELEGGLNQVVALARLLRSAVTIEVAREALGGFRGAGGQIVTLDRVIEEGARLFGIAPSELCGPGRTRTLVTARHVAMYVCRVLTKESYPAIARAFNKQDHTSVIHAHLKVEQLMQRREAVYFQVVELMHRLGAEPQQDATVATKLFPR